MCLQSQLRSRRRGEKELTSGAEHQDTEDATAEDNAKRNQWGAGKTDEDILGNKPTASKPKQDDDWKILQLQFSSNLFDNPLVNSAKNNLIMFTVISALAGILIGFLAGRRRKAND